VLDEPRVHQKLPGLVNFPNSHRFVSTAGHKKLHFLNKNHVEDRSGVTDDSLERVSSFLVFGLPQFDGAVSAGSNQNVEVFDLGVYDAPHITLNNHHLAFLLCGPALIQAQSPRVPARFYHTFSVGRRSVSCSKIFCLK